MYTKFDDSNFRYSRDIVGPPKFKIGDVTMTTPFEGCCIIRRMQLDIAYQ